jgi:hypothetical protein
MKKILTLIVLFAAGTAAAQNHGEQLNKQLEVTRAYTPRVGQANKLSITPDMTDTVRLKPDVTYTINSTASTTTFSVRPFAAAKMNSAPFEMRRPFYLRTGVGVPLRSVFDMYYAPRMRNDRTFGIYANHRGLWSNLRNESGLRVDAAEKYFEAGIFGAKHLDSLENYIISGELAYDYRGYEPYGISVGRDVPEMASVLSVPHVKGARYARFFRDRVRGNIAIGDNFLDLTRFNYRVGLAGGVSRINDRENQSDFDFNFRAAQMYGDKKNQGFEALFRVRAAIDLDDNSASGMPGGVWPSKDKDGNEIVREGSASTVTFEPRFVVQGRRASLRVGFVARYVNNRAWNQNYLSIRPSLEANIDITRGVFVPFVSYTSNMIDGSVEATSRRNPYIYLGYPSPTGWINDARIGFAGDLGDVFSYRISGGMSLFVDYPVFTAVQEIEVRDHLVAGPAGQGSLAQVGGAVPGRIVTYLPVWFEPAGTDGTRFTVGAEFGVQGIGGFTGRAYVNWNLYDMHGVWKDKPVGEMSPWDGGFEVAYNHRKLLNVRLDAHVTGYRDYNIRYRILNMGTIEEVPTVVRSLKPSIDISLAADYELMNNFWVFMEGHNLAGMRLYPYPTYRGHGAGLMAGIKLAF